jgi:hypothetical protein
MEGSSRKVLPLQLRGGTEEPYENPVRLAGLRAEIWTRELPNTKQVC